MTSESKQKPSSWRVAGGEMGALIRAHDWAATPLGSIENWPQALRSTVEMLIVHGFPMVALWGPDLIQIYNDGYRIIMAGKHPQGLGQRTAECWPEVWHINEPIYRRVWAGETLTFEDALYPIARHGPLEDAWFTLTYSPLRGDDGAIAGVLVTVFETSERHLADQRRNASERLLRVALDGGRMGAWRWDLQHGLIWGDAQFLSLWGLPSSNDPHPLALFTRRMSPVGAAEIGTLVNRSIEAGEEFDGQLEIESGPTAGRWIRWRGCADSTTPSILFGTSFDVTEQRQAEEALRRSEERQTFLLKLSDALRPLADAEEIRLTAAQILGRHLRAARVAYGEDTGDEHFNVTRNYVDGVPDASGRYRYSDFGADLLADLRSGRPRVQPDIWKDDRLSDKQKQALAAHRIGASLTVSLVKGGRLVAFLGVNYSTAHNFTAEEINLVRETADRTWAAVASARAEAALRASEDRYRTLFESIDDAFVIVEMLYDTDGKPADHRFLEANPAFERQTGLAEAMAGSVLPMVSGHEQRWFEIFARIDRTREPERFEQRAEALDRWHEVYAFPVGEPQQHRVAVLFHDVTERRRAEQTLRESEERQAFLLKLSDTLRTAVDPIGIQHAAMRLVGEHLGLTRAFYFLVERDEQGCAHVIESEYRRDPTQPGMIGRHSLSRFGSWMFEGLAQGKVLEIADVNSLAGLTPEELASYQALAVAAFINLPLLRHGEYNAGITAHSDIPRVWTPAEITLLRDVGDRTAAAVERARAEKALQVSEEERRSLIAQMNEGFCLLEVILDDAGRGLDYRFLETNPAFVRQGGFDPAGRLMSEIAPIEPVWPAAYGRVATTGVPERIVDAAAAFGRMYDVYAFRVGDAAARRIAVFFSDITPRYRAEQRLRESEERYRMMFETMDEGYLLADVIFDDSGKAVDIAYVKSNPAAVRMLGKDLTGRRLRDVAEYEEYWYEIWGRVAKTGNPEHLERYAAPDSVWYDFNVFKIEPDNAASRRVAVLFRDVTPRRLAEAALRQSEERLRQFGEASQDVLWIRNAQTFQWEYLTPAFEAIYGLDRAAALRGDNMVSWLELIMPEDRERAAENLRRVQSGEWVTFEYRIRRPVDGEIRWLRNTDFPIRDAAGQVAHIGGVGHDVTALKQIQEALATAEWRQRLLLEGIPQLVWRAVNSGDWTWASPQWTAYTGQAEKASHGLGWLDVVHPDDRTVVRQAWSAAIATGGFEVEYRLCNALTQSYRWFSTRATPVRDDTGAIVEWLGTSTDIDDLRSLQERQTVLVGELQHRTRNLMGVIRSMADKTARASTNLDDFRNRFRDRLGALARVQGLLSRLHEHDRVTFDDLIRTEMSALDGGSNRVTLSGPAGVRLRSTTVQTLALALHELATNAVKYGALSQSAGHLAIQWSIDVVERTPWLHVDWRETGVDMSQSHASPQGGGQGRELIEQALPYQLKARTHYEFTPDGVHCTISLPVSESTQFPEA